MALRRIEVIDELLGAMTARDVPAVQDVLLRHQPTREEVDAASYLRLNDLRMGSAVARFGHPEP